MRIIDLSTAIQPGHFRWRGEQRLHRTHDDGHAQVTWLSGSVHSFTHMDGPRHFMREGATTDAVPLDQVIGEAAVVDVCEARANAPITEMHMRGAGSHVREGDIVLVRAGWDRARDIATPAFWSDAPWMTEEAARWLSERGAKAVGFDFPQDRCIRNAIMGLPEADAGEYVTHQLLLKKGVILIEYLSNLMALENLRTFLVCAPLKLIASDGAPARVIALEELGQT
jgi:arylformamidase